MNHEHLKVWMQLLALDGHLWWLSSAFVSTDPAVTTLVISRSWLSLWWTWWGCVSFSKTSCSSDQRSNRRTNRVPRVWVGVSFVCVGLSGCFNWQTNIGTQLQWTKMKMRDSKEKDLIYAFPSTIRWIYFSDWIHSAKLLLYSFFQGRLIDSKGFILNLCWIQPIQVPKFSIYRQWMCLEPALWLFPESSQVQALAFCLQYSFTIFSKTTILDFH